MNPYYNAQVDVREAWKRQFGHYPMDDQELDYWRRVSDRHLQTILDQAAQIKKLEDKISALEGLSRGLSLFLGQQ